MASTNKCEYCGSTITSNDKKCPYCGASNPLYVEDTERVILTPKTIAELQEFCAERNMPLLRMRFFIGEDFKEPCAFGIYKEEDGKVVVYKNKDTGVRAIRYEGYDEAHGVQELYLKLLDECHKRGIYPETPDGKAPKEYIQRREATKEEQKKERRVARRFTFGVFGVFLSFGILGAAKGEDIIEPIMVFLSLTISSLLLFSHVKYIVNKSNGIVVDGKIATNEQTLKWKKWFLRGWIFFFALLVLVPTLVAFNQYKHPQGYYNTNTGLYYHMGSDWYSYDDFTGDWSYTTDYSDIYSDGRTDYVGESWQSEWGETAYSFTESQAYSDYKDSHYSDSDSGGGYDSWDSGDTDWGSDW